MYCVNSGVMFEGQDITGLVQVHRYYAGLYLDTGVHELIIFQAFVNIRLI